MTQPTHAQIRQIIAECAGVAIERVVPEARLVEGLGLDSMDVVGIVVESEEALNITIPEGEEDTWHTVSDIYRTVEALHG